MKKIIAITLAMLTLLAIPTAALADGSSTFTITVPTAQYTLNIPANQDITYGATVTNIGSVTVTDSSGFAVGKNLKLTVEGAGFEAGMGVFTCEGSEATIPYSLGCEYFDGNGKEVFYGGYFMGQEDGSAAEKIVGLSIELNYDYINLYVSSEDWAKAPVGEYSSTITFSSEVVMGVSW